MAEIVEVPRKVAVACSAYVFPSNLGKYISDSFHVIADFLKERGIDVSGGHYARYHLFTPLVVHVEVGIQLQGEAAIDKASFPPSVKEVELPECKAATVWHVGAYEKLSETYKSLCLYIKKQGLTPGKLCYEEYHTNPETEPDKDKYRTQVFWSVTEGGFWKSMGW